MGTPTIPKIQPLATNPLTDIVGSSLTAPAPAATPTIVTSPQSSQVTKLPTTPLSQLRWAASQAGASPQVRYLLERATASQTRIDAANVSFAQEMRRAAIYNSPVVASALNLTNNQPAPILEFTLTHNIAQKPQPIQAKSNDKPTLSAQSFVTPEITTTQTEVTEEAAAPAGPKASTPIFSELPLKAIPAQNKAPETEVVIKEASTTTLDSAASTKEAPALKKLASTTNPVTTTAEAKTAATIQTPQYLSLATDQNLTSKEVSAALIAISTANIALETDSIGFAAQPQFGSIANESALTPLAQQYKEQKSIYQLAVFVRDTADASQITKADLTDVLPALKTLGIALAINEAITDGQIQSLSKEQFLSIIESQLIDPYQLNGLAPQSIKDNHDVNYDYSPNAVVGKESHLGAQSDSQGDQGSGQQNPN